MRLALAEPVAVTPAARAVRYSCSSTPMRRWSIPTRWHRSWMYRNHRAAWLGFRKNAYLLWGGTPWRFGVTLTLFGAGFVVAPLVWPWALIGLYLLKTASDRYAGYSWGVSLLTPVSIVLGIALQLDSARAHWTGTVVWKGRRTATS